MLFPPVLSDFIEENHPVRVISRSLRTIQPIDFYHNFVENLVV